MNLWLRLIGKVCCCSILLFGTGTACAQTDTTQQDGHLFIDPIIPPEYPGGYEAMFNFIGRNLLHPHIQFSDDEPIASKLIVSFTIDEKGNGTEYKIEKGSGSLLDDEALRVVKLLTGWKPATINNKPVKYRMVIPIRVCLQ